MTTTFPLIRAQQIALIEALTPSRHSTEKFFVFQADQDFRLWAEAAPTSAFRAFDITSSLSVEAPLVSNVDVEEYEQEEILFVAYPHSFGQYSANNRRDLEDIIDADLFQLDKTIGVLGYGNYMAGQHLCELTGSSLVVGEGVTFLNLNYRLLYRRAR